MNTFGTANNTSSKPLEGMKTFVQKKGDTIETEELDIAGFFNETQKPACFDANGKGQLIFNLPRTGVPEVFQKAFESDNSSKLDPSIATELFKDGGYAILGAVQTGVDALGGVARQTGDAFSDLIKITIGQAEKPTEVLQNFQKAFEGDDPSKLDPTIAKKQEQQEVIRARENANTVIENATRQASQQEYEEMIKMALRLGVNVENLADKLDAPHLRKSDLLKAYYLALGDSLQVAEQKAAARTRVNVISSSSKQGGQGVNTDQDRINEGSSILSTTGGGGAG